MTRHVTAAEINDACEAAFKQSADTYDLRVFDFARLIEATVSIRERRAITDAIETANARRVIGIPDVIDMINERSNADVTGLAPA